MLAAVLLGLLSCGISSSALAQEALRSPKTDGVELRIGVVIASNVGTEIDPRLVSQRSQFNRLFPYSSYQLVAETRRKVPWGDRVRVEIPGGRYNLYVIPKGFRSDRVAMRVVLVEGPRVLLNTALSLRDRSTLLMGGPRDPNGVLILSIGTDTVD
jgi:hypothetical protein